MSHNATGPHPHSPEPHVCTGGRPASASPCHLIRLRSPHNLFGFVVGVLFMVLAVTRQDERNACGDEGCSRRRTLGTRGSARTRVVRTRERIAGVLGPAVPPSPPTPGRGRPRTQVERGSLGSGRPPHPAGDQRTGRHPKTPAPQLSAAEWAALRQLEGAHHSVVSRWPVGRAIARALIGRGLVHTCSEWVWLTEAGHQALGAARAHRPIHAPSAQPHATTPADRRPPRTAATDSHTARQSQPTGPVRRPAGAELPPGVLRRPARSARSRRP
jgi:hypothetical protein